MGVGSEVCGLVCRWEMGVGSEVCGLVCRWVSAVKSVALIRACLKLRRGFSASVAPGGQGCVLASWSTV